MNSSIFNYKQILRTDQNNAVSAIGLFFLGLKMISKIGRSGTRYKLND